LSFSFIFYTFFIIYIAFRLKTDSFFLPGFHCLIYIQILSMIAVQCQELTLFFCKKKCWLFGELAKRDHEMPKCINLAQPAQQSYFYYNIFFKI